MTRLRHQSFSHGEKGYWICDYHSFEPTPAEALNQRTDQMWERLEVALPNPSTKEGRKQLAAVARHCLSLLPKETAADEVVAPIAIKWGQLIGGQQLSLLEAAQ